MIAVYLAMATHGCSAQIPEWRAGCFIVPPNGGVSMGAVRDGWPAWCVENTSQLNLGWVWLRLSDGKKLEILMSEGVHPCKVPVS